MRIVIINYDKINDKNYVKFNDMNYFKESNLLQRKSFKIKIRKNIKDIKELSEREFLKWTAKESKFSVSIRDRDFERVLIIFLDSLLFSYFIFYTKPIQTN